MVYFADAVTAQRVSLPLETEHHIQQNDTFSPFTRAEIVIIRPGIQTS